MEHETESDSSRPEAVGVEWPLLIGGSGPSEWVMALNEINERLKRLESPKAAHRDD